MDPLHMQSVQQLALDLHSFQVPHPCRHLHTRKRSQSTPSLNCLSSSWLGLPWSLWSCTCSSCCTTDRQGLPDLCPAPTAGPEASHLISSCHLPESYNYYKKNSNCIPLNTPLNPSSLYLMKPLLLECEPYCSECTDPDTRPLVLF